MYRLLVGYYIYSGVHIKFGVPHKWTEHLTQLREAERRRDEAVARMDQLLAEMGYPGNNMTIVVTMIKCSISIANKE